MTKLSDTTRNKLKTISTATVATALFKRGLRVQCIQDVHPLNPDQPTLVGEAFTLRYMPAREDLNTLDAFRDRTHPQRAPRLRRGALLIRVHADWVPALRSSVARCTASGTRNHRPEFCEDCWGCYLSNNIRSWLWVPAFAGTTK